MTPRPILTLGGALVFVLAGCAHTAPHQATPRAQAAAIAAQAPEVAVADLAGAWDRPERAGTRVRVRAKLARANWSADAGRTRLGWAVRDDAGQQVLLDNVYAERDAAGSLDPTRDLAADAGRALLAREAIAVEGIYRPSETRMAHSAVISLPPRLEALRVDGRPVGSLRAR